MKKYLLAGVAVLSMATSANAADLISAAVTGPSGTVWNTNSADGYYSLFLVRPFGNVINPTDNFTTAPTTVGSNDYTIAGDGFPGGTTANSDLSYTLTLRFADGATILGQYVGSTFTGGTTATAGNTTYTMTGFGWDRSPANNVSPFNIGSGGDRADYTGQFSFDQVNGAVPEPATWAMMMIGFGMVGFGLRRRSKIKTTVSYA
jgi:hypothetical protein